MGNEAKIIRLIAEKMPRSDLQINKVFESDSEIIDVNGNKLLVNVDEFSEEDMFREHDPFSLGWNLTAGSISDIYATGGKPVFFAHSLVVNESWTEDYISRFSEGIASCLKRTNTAFIGGDFGTSSVWRYTATVIGQLDGKPLLRSNAKENDFIYMTGKIGLGNFEAGLKLYSKRVLVKQFGNSIKNRLVVRDREAELIRKYSECCIDSSDGVFNALSSICEVSNVGFELFDLQYIKSGLLLSKLLNIPKTLLLLGECGEYELVFTVKSEFEKQLLDEANKMGLHFYKIGRVTKSKDRVLKDGAGSIDLSRFDIRARDFKDPKIYLKHIIEFLRG